jgi:hypothetical protein
VSITDDRGKGPKSGGNLNAGLFYILSIALIDFFSIMAIIKKNTIVKLLDDVLLNNLVKLREYSSKALKRI